MKRKPEAKRLRQHEIIKTLYNIKTTFKKVVFFWEEGSIGGEPIDPV